MAKQEQPKTRTVTVAVAREGQGGWYSGGRYWANGRHDNVQLTEEQITGLLRRPGVVVIQGGRTLSLGDDGIESGGERAAAALSGLQDAPAGGGAAGAADAPLLAADILHGNPPPENSAASVKPLDAPTGRRK